ncbi:DUF7681 family protein [Oceaniglobus trochenteri]|uniref:Acb2/Tad1 domain-containing protein n=1 Tax=Oceaniglobus trochenteri TaxID=2763260 RepID=UPI001CFFD957|nr:cyclic nucleotide-binding protein [Oceaniglobus trochenteri]
MSDTRNPGLPVSGYRPQSGENIALVECNKQIEEHLLRVIDQLGARSETDKRWLAIGRTQIEQGFMALNRSIFQPGRIELPGDNRDS